MPSVKEAAAAFLADQRVVVSGVSRNPQGPWSNLVYQRLRARGLDVVTLTSDHGTRVVPRTVPCRRLAAVPPRVPSGIRGAWAGARPGLQA